MRVAETIEYHGEMIRVCVGRGGPSLEHTGMSGEKKTKDVGREEYEEIELK